jgi:RNA polymerase sigma-70 factor, ECF subfamily
MSDQPESTMTGKFEARYVAFLETINQLRPSLHRYCARMTGSVMDGEDVVQEAVFEAYRKLDQFDDSRPLSPWLFRIAHNRSIDFLRRSGVRQEAETIAMEPNSMEQSQLSTPPVGRAVEHLVLALPPMERACVLLKDVFDYTLEETAELVDSTVGGVKAALNRGRSKLATLPGPSTAKRTNDPELAQLSRMYVERFNRRDWEGLRELISADARLTVADRFRGRMDESGYFGVYSRWPVPLRLATGEVDGEPVIIIHGQTDGEWVPQAMMRFRLEDHRVGRITDYIHCPWVLTAASEITVHAFS